uniref:Laccase-4 n=1 Tax=Aegilops tauschii TaxID=37682 RepID=M8C3F7_AEGTA
MAISSRLPAPCYLLMATLMLLIIQAQSITRHYDFNVQTANVTRLCASKSIVTANFYMSAAPYSVIRPGTFDNTTVAGILEYHNPHSASESSFDKDLPLFKPTLPRFNDTGLVTNFTSKLRSLATPQYPAAVCHAPIWIEETRVGR